MCEYCDDVCELDWKYGLDHILPDYSYCPMCGRHLTPEEPLTLDELKQMNGEPVWVWFASDLQRWGLVDTVNKCVYGSFSTPYFKDYIKTWLAYRRKPEA